MHNIIYDFFPWLLVVLHTKLTCLSKQKFIFISLKILHILQTTHTYINEKQPHLQNLKLPWFPTSRPAHGLKYFYVVKIWKLRNQKKKTNREWRHFYKLQLLWHFCIVIKFTVTTTYINTLTHTCAKIHDSNFSSKHLLKVFYTPK